jgi:hypothetical protein
MNNNKKEAIEQIYKLLMTLVDEEDNQEQIPQKTESKSTRNKKTSPTRKSKTQSNNKFDSMPEKNMFREDVEIDRKLSVVEPCPRTRSFHTIEVSCRVCGKKDKLNPALVNEPTRYKCNNCSKSGG